MITKKYAVNLNEGSYDSEVLTNMKDITAGISFYVIQSLRFEQIVDMLKPVNQLKAWKFRVVRIIEYLNSMMFKFKDDINKIGINIEEDRRLIDRVRNKKLKKSEYEHWNDKCYMTILKIASQIPIDKEAEILMGINYQMKTVEDYIRTECVDDLRRLGIEFDLYYGVTKRYN